MQTPVEQRDQTSFWIVKSIDWLLISIPLLGMVFVA